MSPDTAHGKCLFVFAKGGLKTLEGVNGLLQRLENLVLWVMDMYVCQLKKDTYVQAK